MWVRSITKIIWLSAWNGNRRTCDLFSMFAAIAILSGSLLIFELNVGFQGGYSPRKRKDNMGVSLIQTILFRHTQYRQVTTNN